MSDLRCSQLVFGDWEHWEQQWCLASRRDQAPDERLLGGVLLAYFLALSAVELADGLGANFEHAVLHPVLLVFAGADGALHQHE